MPGSSLPKFLLQSVARGFRPLLPLLPKLRNRHFLLFDIAALCLTPVLALMLRLDGGERLYPYLGALVAYSAVGLAIRLAVFYPFQLYNRYWRYATVDELMLTILAIVASTAGIMVPFIACQGYGGWGLPLPRSIPFMDAFLALMAVGGSRFSVRLAHGLQRAQAPGNGRRVLIIGAGSTGQMVARELLSNPQVELVPVGYLDDDEQKQGTHIHSIPVLGGLADLAKCAGRHAIAQVVIAMPTAPGKIIRECLTLCEAAGIPAKTVPAMYEILGGAVSVNHLRNVEIEDLLRRDTIETDFAAVRDLIRGKRVLVTGGGGSIGGELCRQLLRCGPSELMLLGHGENSVFGIHNELQDTLKKSAGCHARDEAPLIHAVIGDIRFPDRIRNVVGQFRPHVIFHAAAHKHVPLMEMHPAEAIANNVRGTKNLLDAALTHGVEQFVLISTDKAVNPTSVMGASKRVAEMLVLQAARQSGRKYVAVRFGNVLGSRGSVVLTFKRQIAAGGPVTVSDPEMKRFFMTIPEAVQLVLQASALGRGGEIFVLDMGEPVRIVDLARDLIELSGLELGRDIDILYTGIRPGEKLFEELFVKGESYQRTHHEKILIAENASAILPPNLEQGLAALELAAERDDRTAIVCCLRNLIPEYAPGPGPSQVAVQKLLEQPSPSLVSAS